MQYRRIVLKISGEALSSSAKSIDDETVRRTAKMIADAHQKGVQMSVMVGGGNILRGRSAGEIDRNRADHMGMLATCINALALENALVQCNVPCRVLSALEMPEISEQFTARGAISAMERGEIVLLSCGMGLPFVSTDTASAMRACQLHAQALLLAKNVDAVYSADPREHPDAIRYRSLSYDRVVRENLNATDLTAITLCKEQHMPIHLFSLAFLRDACEGKDVGTVISE